MPYLLDANVFISAKNLHYGLDFCPAFWDWIIAKNTSGAVFSIEKVGDEVLALADQLSVWADARGAGFFLQPGAADFPALAEVSNWANGQNYEPSAVSTFLQVADYYLVAQALAGHHTVVTHQVRDSVRDASARACAVYTGPNVIKGEARRTPSGQLIGTHYVGKNGVRQLPQRLRIPSGQVAAYHINLAEKNLILPPIVLVSALSS